MGTKLIKTIATVFGIGYIPVAQGTLASLLGLGIYLLMYRSTSLYVLSSSILVVVGFLVSGKAERMFGEKDSRKIVIDDFCGILLAYLFVPFRTSIVIIGFVLYRLFDITKIYPVKKLERLPAGWGIMLDDLACGIYANIILQVLSRILIC